MKRAKVFHYAKGFTGRNKNVWVAAKARVEKALQYAYVSRRLKKRDNRQSWIHQINAGAKAYGMKYSELMHGLTASNILLNRKVLAELAVQEPVSFNALVQHVRTLGLEEQRKDLQALSDNPREAKRRLPPVRPPHLSLREEHADAANYRAFMARLAQQYRNRAAAASQPPSSSPPPTPSS